MFGELHARTPDTVEPFEVGIAPMLNAWTGDAGAHEAAVTDAAAIVDVTLRDSTSLDARSSDATLDGTTADTTTEDAPMEPDTALAQCRAASETLTIAIKPGNSGYFNSTSSSSS